MKIVLIVNPNSGRKNGKKLVSLVESKLSVHSIDCDTFISLYHGHIPIIVSKLEIKKYDAVIAMGGDGTNYHVLNALLSHFDIKDIPDLGIIPVGAGNSFAKDIRIHSLDDAINAIVDPHPKAVDVCSFTQHNKTNKIESRFYFINLTGLGFVTDVAKTADKFKFFKDFSYIIGVLYRTIFLKFHEIQLEFNGMNINNKNCFVEFCNSRYTGGNMLIAPNAKIDDGYFDIIVAGKLSRWSLLCTLPKIFTGKHLENPAVQHYKTKKAVIKTTPAKTLLPDGEIFGTTPVTIQIHPKLVRYL